MAPCRENGISSIDFPPSRSVVECDDPLASSQISSAYHRPRNGLQLFGPTLAVEAIDDGAFVVDDQAVAYWVGQAVELARQGIDNDSETDAPPVGYSCAECGVQDARNYVVTILDHDDIRHTRTEVCIPCAITVSADSVDRIIAGIITR